MKATSRVSIWLNLVLLGCLTFVLANRRKEAIAPAPASVETKSAAQTAANPTPPSPVRIKSEPFRWRQLGSATNYRVFVANLRASGCPEATIEDIVRGDTSRAFSWERDHLGLGESGSGPWSRASEEQLVASLLGEPPVAGTTEAAASARTAENQTAPMGGGEVADIRAPPQGAGAATPAYPLFLQDVNWSALGFDAGQQAAIAQARQQFVNEMNGLNQNPNEPAKPNSDPAGSNPGNPAYLQRWQTALQNADDALRASLGADGYNAYVQQQYFQWYQPQVMANAGSGNLTINAGAFSVSQ